MDDQQIIENRSWLWTFLENDKSNTLKNLKTYNVLILDDELAFFLSEPRPNL
jgi:hypothetical protein